MTRPLYAIVLAGGRARRMGGVDKPAQTVGETSMLATALRAASGADRVVLVGPDRPGFDSMVGIPVVQVREEPAGSGPVAALRAGVAALPDAVADVAVLAADLPFLDRGTVDALSTARRQADAPAALALDSAGRLQYLVGVWDAERLRQRLEQFDGTAMRGLVPVDALGIRLPDRIITDVDTPAELARARDEAAPRRRRQSPVDARAAIARTCRPVAADTVDLAAATGGVLAADLCAAVDFPAFDTAAMDGYAVAGHGPWIDLGWHVTAGAPAAPAALRPGEAVRIATGAMVPAGADRVVRDEEVNRDATSVHGPGPERDDTRRRGSEWRAGDVLVEAGAAVDDWVASVAGSAGVTTMRVRTVSAVVHSTGDEVSRVVRAGEASGLIVDTASAPVTSVVRRSGCRVTVGEHLGDDHATFTHAIASSGAADLIVFIGATGRGVADHLRRALDGLHADIVVDGIDMRPGGSVLVAAVPDGPIVLGLGGNPLAAVAGAALLAPSITAALTGAAPVPPERLIVAGVETLARASSWRIVPVHPGEDGQWTAPKPVPTAHLLSMVGAGGLALIPPDAPAGLLVERL